jgi:hypothetical protein
MNRISPYIKLGQEATVTLSYLPDREFRGRVTYIYPNVDEKTRTARVRMEFHNPGYFLKPGMFATVKVVSELEPSVLLIPDMAILRSGEKTTVFVALDGGKFDPRTVTLGPQAENDKYQVLSGVERGRADCHVGPVHARFGKPASRGDSENAGAEGAAGVRSRDKRSGFHGRRRNHYLPPRPRFCEIYLPDAGACLHRIRSSGQLSHLRHDARAGVPGDASRNSSRAGKFSTTPARCRRTATCVRTNRASAPSAA